VAVVPTQVIAPRSRGRARARGRGSVPFRASTAYGWMSQGTYQNLHQNNPYMAMLIQPGAFSMRLPDENSRPSALYSSERYISVTGNSAAGTPDNDSGKFCFIVRPVIGSNVATHASTYAAQILEFDPSIDWNQANFQNGANYIVFNDTNTTTMEGVPNGGNTAFTTFGMVRDYRPVAMSVWFQFQGDTLNDGGQIAACLVDGTLLQQIFTNAPVAPGYLQEYANLSVVPGAYDGSLRKGCYTFWYPWDIGDSDFKPPYSTAAAGIQSAELYNYPAIVVSGRTTKPGDIIGRLEVRIIFEYTTSSRVPDTESSPVAPELITQARKILSRIPTSMANDEHNGIIQQALSLAGPMGARALRIGLPMAMAAAGRASGAPLGGIRGAMLGRRFARLALGD